MLVPDGDSAGPGMTTPLLQQVPSFATLSERRFAEKLRGQLPDDALIFANQRFTDRHGDRQADLIVLWPGLGIAVIEVQGGLVHFLEGQWRLPSTNAQGWERVDPVERALKAKYALRDYLHQHPRWTRGNPRTIHMIAIPAGGLDVDFHTPDAPRWLVLDRTDLPHVAERIASALRSGGAQPAPPTQADVRQLVDCLAGAAVPQRDLLMRLGEREDTFELISEEQARVLDLTSDQGRVEIRGGAGSGKTWLAIELARRLATSGRSVAVMCSSPGLAEFLSRRTDLLARGQRPTYVGTFHGLGLRWGVEPPSEDDVDYWERTLPNEMASFAAGLLYSERFDSIVIDEAEDFAESWWPIILATLRDPEASEVYVFSDENERVLAGQRRPPMSLVTLDLSENLRNTKQIAQTYASLTPVAMRARGAAGRPVRFVQCAPDKAVEYSDVAIKALLEENWPADSLALLTTDTPHPYQVQLQEQGEDAYWSSLWDDEYPFYGHVLDFTGLERPAVILAVNGFEDEQRAREMLYVGLSRPRDLLVVCGDLAMIRRLGGDDVANRLSKPASTSRAATSAKAAAPAKAARPPSTAAATSARSS